MTESKLDPEDRMTTTRSKARHREQSREAMRRLRAKRKAAKDPYELEAPDDLLPKLRQSRSDG